ncbi:hypothetical protein APHAL10511_005647 [Amanita phalloides]|nr:hypothetical protein APHAL10511_005647 [Amanita phalloides]
MSLPFISLIRLPVLGVLTAFSVIVLGIGAHILDVTVPTLHFYFSFVALAVAIPALTFLTVVPSIVVSLIRGAAPMHIIVESVWLGVLWVLWLATAAYTANSTILLPTVCDYSFFVGGKSVSCNEIQALQAFSWLNWLLLTAYVPTVFVLSIIAQSRKSKPVQPVQHVASPNQQQIYPPSPQQQQMYAPQPVYQQPVPQQMPQQMQQMSPQQMPQQMSPQQMPHQMSPQQMPQQMQEPYVPATPPTGYVTPPPRQMQAPYTPATPPVGYSTPPPQNQAPANPGYSPV